MKSPAKTLMCCAILCALLTANTLVWSQQINWVDSVEMGREAAAHSSQLVMLQFGADWCRPCQELKSFVFTSPAVIRTVNQAVIPVLVDIDQYPDLARKYKVEGVPTTVFITHNDQVVQKRSSPLDADAFQKMLAESSKASQAINAGGETTLNELSKLNSKWEEANKPASDALALQKFAHQIPTSPLSPTAQLSESGVTKPMQFNATSTNSTGFQSQSGTNTNAFVVENQAKSGTFQFSTTQQSARTTSPSTTPNNTNSLGGMEAGSLDIGTASPLASSTPESPFDNLMQTSGTDQLRVVNRYVQPATSAPDAKPSQIGDNKPIPSNGVATATPNSTEATSPKQSVTNTSAAAVANLPTVALDGDCPVSLMTTSQWVKGDAKFGCVHRGRIYLLASQECQDTFLKDPDSYSPLLAGFDPVIYQEESMLVEGQKSHGVFMSRQGRQHVVLFRDEDTRAKFRENPAIYLECIRAATEGADDK